MGEDLGRHGAGEVLRDLDDANALERQHGAGAHAFAAAIASSMTGSKRWLAPSRTMRPGCGKWAAQHQVAGGGVALHERLAGHRGLAPS